MFQGKSLSFHYCYVSVSFVHVVSFNYVPNIETNSIYYDILVNEECISINTAIACFGRFFLVLASDISPSVYKPIYSKTPYEVCISPRLISGSLRSSHNKTVNPKSTVDF